jgi:lipopolysaccharide heptosyltransferase II
MKKILIIQTAFIGDAILATAFIDVVRFYFPDSKIDFLLRKGNEEILKYHPEINKVLIWNKKNKWSSFFEELKYARQQQYDIVFNLQRFFTSALFTILSGAKLKIGFKNNFLSHLFNYRVDHFIPSQPVKNFKHEVERNFEQMKVLVDTSVHPLAFKLRPKLFFGDLKLPAEISLDSKFIVMAPASVWFTKQFAKEKWIELIAKLNSRYPIYLIGAPSDKNLCDEIKEKSGQQNIVNLCGKLSLLQSALLMKSAYRTVVNDSAPLHLASSVNTPTIALFCSTIPAFGFGPLADQSLVIEVENLYCKPCGVHGHSKCPQGHFKCSYEMNINKIIDHIIG